MAAACEVSVILALSLAHRAFAVTLSALSDHPSLWLRQKTEIARLNYELALMREIARIKDARFKRVSASERPHYSPEERFAILELRAAQGWSAEQAARVFLVTTQTVASWMKRVDEGGKAALVRLIEPVQKYPEFVTAIIQRLRLRCAHLGRRKIAQVLARAGLRLGASTVQRMLRKPQVPEPKPERAKVKQQQSGRTVTAKYPGHVWRHHRCIESGWVLGALAAEL